MKILLIQPPFNPNLIGGGILYMNEPLALESLAGAVRDCDVRILDMRIDAGLEKELADFKPDIAGITAYTTDVYVANGILQRIKAFDKNILTVVGGHHATLRPADFFNDHADLIVLGEGQFSFREIVERHRAVGSFNDIQGIIINKPERIFTACRKLEDDLDVYPLPDRTPTKGYRDRYFRASWRPVASIMTSRGCPHRCNFCSVWKREDGRYRMRSPENVVKELMLIEEQFVSVSDDNFLHNIPRAVRLYEMIRDAGIKKTYKLIGRSDTIVKHPDVIVKWKEIGMDMVFLGLESSRDDEIRSLKKTTSVKTNNEAIRILHGNGIKVAGQFIIYPDYTKDDFDRLADYVREMNLVHPIFSVLTPLPETDLYEEKKGELLTGHYEMFDLAHSVLPTKLPREEFYRYFAELYRNCYTEKDDGKRVVPNKLIESLYGQILNAHGLLQAEE